MTLEENSHASIHKNESNAKQTEDNIVANQSTSVIQQPIEEEQSEKDNQHTPN